MSSPVQTTIGENHLSIRRSILALPILALLVSSYVLSFTRLGVFIVFDLIGDIQGADATRFTYSDAPAHISHVLQRFRQIELPKQIEQVSGIYVTSNRIALSTDQTELFIVDRGFPPLMSRSNLIPWTPLLLRQGSLEALTFANGGFLLAGEASGLVSISVSGQRTSGIDLPKNLQGIEINGLAHREGTFFATSSDPRNVMQWDAESTDAQELTLDFGEFGKAGAVPDYQWSGIALVGSKMYLVSEN